MTAPEREALVKALRDASDGWSGDASCVSADIAAQAADMIEAQHRHIEMHAGDTLSLDGEIQLLQVMLKEALEQIHALKSTPAVTVTEEMVERAINSLVYTGYNDEAQRKVIARQATCRDYVRNALEAALKSTTPQTGSQE